MWWSIAQRDRSRVAWNLASDTSTVNLCTHWANSSRYRYRPASFQWPLSYVPAQPRWTVRNPCLRYSRFYSILKSAVKPEETKRQKPTRKSRDLDSEKGKVITNPGVLRFLRGPRRVINLKNSFHDLKSLPGVQRVVLRYLYKEWVKASFKLFSHSYPTSTQWLQTWRFHWKTPSRR